eukprot:Skav228828  [mRNA]  locus=scaffold359:580949:585478:+ [translate_table: standard]
MGPACKPLSLQSFVRGVLSEDQIFDLTKAALRIAAVPGGAMARSLFIAAAVVCATCSKLGHHKGFLAWCLRSLWMWQR